MKKVEDNGLKQTDVGFIPKDWELDTLGNIFNIQQGKSLSPKSRRGISPQPFLRTANVLWGRVDLSKLDQMDFSEPEIAKLALEMEDLLICEGGDIGRTAIWEKQIPLCLYQNHLHRLRANRSEIIPRFYMYWMQAALTLLGLYEGAGNRTTIPNLSRSRLSSFLVPVPSKKEQEAIVIILRKLQKVISQQEQIILKTKELKRSLMHRLFTYGLRGEELKETEIGLMPKSWEPMSISDISDKLIGGGTPSTKIPQYWKGNIEWTTSKRLGENIYLYDGEKKISENGLNNSSTNLIPKDNLLISTRVTVGKAVVNKADIAISQDLTGMIINKDRYSSEFIVYQFKIGRIQKIFDEQKRGATIKGITRGDLKKIKLGIPDIKEQKEITNMLSNVDKKIQQAETRMQGFQALFKSMLQLLMTGQVRVKDIDFGEIYPVRET
jgi:type I restriction enzyme S subunit